MSKAVHFKQPTVRPSADDWVESRVKVVSANTSPAVDPVTVAAATAPAIPVAVMPPLVEASSVAKVAAPASLPAPPNEPAAQVVSKETVPLPVAPAPRVLLERAKTRMSVSIDVNRRRMLMRWTAPAPGIECAKGCSLRSEAP